MKAVIKISEPPERPATLLAEGEIHFVEGFGFLTGFKLVGFSVRPSREGVYVTLPSRAFGAGNERRYFDFVRACEGPHEQTDLLREMVRQAWEKWKAGKGDLTWEG